MGVLAIGIFWGMLFKNLNSDFYAPQASPSLQPWVRKPFIFGVCSLLLQVYLLLFLCVVLVLYGYLQPYKKHLANTLEIIVELNFLFLLLLVSSQVLEQYYTIPSPTPSILEPHNSSECTGGSSLAVAPVTWILTPFYYLPLLILTGAVIVRITQPLISTIR